MMGSSFVILIKNVLYADFKENVHSADAWCSHFCAGGRRIGLEWISTIRVSTFRRKQKAVANPVLAAGFAIIERQKSSLRDKEKQNVKALFLHRQMSPPGMILEIQNDNALM